jgi:hypothetical protein
MTECRRQDAAVLWCDRCPRQTARAGTQFTCFTSAKVHPLTQKALPGFALLALC